MTPARETGGGALRGLVDRIQDALEEDRELDLAIWNAVSKFPAAWHPSFPPQTVIEVDQYGAGAVGNPLVTLERFTASVDDAISLLSDLQWSKSLDGYVYVHRPDSSIGCHVSGATLALKLCAGAVWHAAERADREPRP